VPKKWQNQIAVILFVVSGFYLLCLVMLDYYQNCGANCLAVHSALSVFHNFDFAAVFPIINLFPIPLTLRLFVPCLILFAILLASFSMLRIEKGLLRAALDVFDLALLVVVLFEAGLLFLAPDWWQVHFSK